MRFIWRSLLVAVVFVVSASAAPVTTASAVAVPARWERAPTQEPGSACAARDRDRFADCKSSPFSWVLRNANGEWIGSVDLAVTLSEVLEPGRRDWTAHYTVVVENLAGAAAAGTTAAIVPECEGPCSAGNGLPDNGAALTQNQVISGDVSFSSGGTRVSKSTQSISVFLFNPAAVGTGTTKDDEQGGSTLGPVRCDSATPAEHLGATARPGCVMSNVAPTLDLASDWGQGPTPAHDAFVRRAQADPKSAGYGRVGSGRPLIREYLPPSQQAKKRYQVCGRSSADGEGTCDEYPYSSSRQGVPDYAVTGSVPGDQNYRAGRKLSSFYANARVLDGDPYYVRP